jgi:hypothetical protein
MKGGVVPENIITCVCLIAWPVNSAAHIDFGPQRILNVFTLAAAHIPDDNAFIHDAGMNRIPSPLYQAHIKLTPAAIVPQVLPHEAKARQSAEAESSYPTVDPSSNWQHHPVCSIAPLHKLERQLESYQKNKGLTGQLQIQRQATTLA